MTSPHLIPATTTTLKPAEIAYLVHGGDINHAMIVLAVDLLQRAVKEHGDSTFSESLSEYEKNMFSIVTKALKDWTSDKIQSTVLGGARSPIQIARRIRFLYNFVRTSLAGLISDIIADPLRIKKYFSPQGVLRIIADFTASGYKHAFHSELRKDLIRRGLLVEEAARVKASKDTFVIATILFIVAFGGAIALSNNVLLALLLWCSTLFSAALARIMLSLRALIPLYDEIAIVVDQVKRRSFRLRLIRILLHSLNIIIWSAILTVIAVTCGLTLLVVKLAFASSFSFAAYATIALLLANFASVHMLFRAQRLAMEERATPAARAQLAIIKNELDGRSPLDAFKTTLISAEYDPAFSRLLALYGVELLVVLA